MKPDCSNSSSIPVALPPEVNPQASMISCRVIPPGVLEKARTAKPLNAIFTEVLCFLSKTWGG